MNSMTRIKFKIFTVLVVYMSLLLTACSSESPRLQRLQPDDVIVAFGDSLTYGVGAPQDKSYPVVLAGLLKMTVINEGVSGEETVGGLKRIDAVLQKYQPQLVILCLGGNDQLRKRSPAVIKENLKMLIRHIRATGSEVFLIAPPKLSISLSVPALYAELGEEEGVPVDDVTLPDLLGQTEMRSDYIHFNAVGYQAFAEAIAADLKKVGAVQ